MKAAALVVAAALTAVPCAAGAQSWFDSRNPTWPGFYIGAQGGANWLLNNQSYVMDTGWTAGGKLGYDFVGPRFEVEGTRRNALLVDGRYVDELYLARIL